MGGASSTNNFRRALYLPPIRHLQPRASFAQHRLSDDERAAARAALESYEPTAARAHMRLVRRFLEGAAPRRDSEEAVVARGAVDDGAAAEEDAGGESR